MKKIKIFAIIAVFLLQMVPMSVLAKEPDFKQINLTVGAELVGSDSTKWTKLGDNDYCYAGDGYEYHTASVSADSADGTLIIDGSKKLSSFYDYEKLSLQFGKIKYETPAVISANFVLNDALQSVENLTIKSVNGTSIVIGKHADDAQTSLDEGDDLITYSGVSIRNYDDRPTSTLALEGSFDITMPSKQTGYNFSAISSNVKTSLGTESKKCDVSIHDISFDGQYAFNAENGNAVGVGINDELSISANSSLKIDNIKVKSNDLASMDAVKTGGAITIGKDALVDIGNLNVTALSGNSFSDIRVDGIKAQDSPITNYGTINVGTDNRPLMIDYFNRTANDGDGAYSYSEGVSAFTIDNYGKINVENLQSRFRSNASSDGDEYLGSGVNGIYTDYYINSYEGSEINVNKENGFLLDANEQFNHSAEAEDFWAYGIEISHGTITATDSNIYARAGKLIANVNESCTLNAVGIFAGEIELNGKSTANIYGNSAFVKGANDRNHKDNALVVYKLGVNDNSSLVADATAITSQTEGSAINILDSLLVNDNASLECISNNTPTISVAKDATNMTLGEGYSPRVYAGKDAKSAVKSYDIKDADGNYLYNTNEYFKVSNVIKQNPTVTLSAKSYYYDGKSHKPTVKTNSDGKVTVPSAKLPATYTVKVAGTNEFNSASADFKIVVKPTTISKLSKGEKSFTVTATKQDKTYITGYQVRYSTSADMKNATTKTIGDAYTKTSKKIDGLGNGKKYYVQVRTYKTIDGKKYYSAWSSSKTVTTKLYKTTTEALNAYTSTKFSTVVTSFKKGTKLEVVSSNAGTMKKNGKKYQMAKVIYNGKTYYVANQYLK